MIVMKPELSHNQHPSPKSTGRFASISTLFLHLNQFVIQQVERRDPDQMEREDQYHVRQIENQRNSGGRHYSLVTVNKEGETRGDIQLSVHCNVLAFSCFLFESKFVNPFRRAEPPTFTAKDAKELLCQGWRATGIRDGSHQNRESDKEGKFTLIIFNYVEVWASNLAKVLIVVIIVFLFRLVNGGRQLAP